jgi:hypothetical protein
VTNHASAIPPLDTVVGFETATWAVFEGAHHLVVTEPNEISSNTVNVACIAGAIGADYLVHVAAETLAEAVPGAHHATPVCGVCRATLEDIADVE